MSKAQHGDIRRAIGEYLHKHGATMRTAVEESVADEMDAERETVAEQLDVCERKGYVYIVNEEVRIP